MTDFTKTIEDRFDQFWEDNNLSAVCDIDRAFFYPLLSSLKAEVDRSWREKIEGKRLQKLEGVLPEFKPTEIYTKGYNQALQNLLDDLIK